LDEPPRILPGDLKALALALGLAATLLALWAFLEIASHLKGRHVFKGYKTYIVAAVAVVGAVASYLVGDSSLNETAQIVVTALLGTTIRHGLKTGA
jgi:hypothetical protein